MNHILLIDDERKITEPLRASFERDGYQVSVAAEGYSGLSLALVSKPDVVLLDVMMPGLNGWQVCEALRQANFNAPIIMLTALDDSTDRIKGLELGADDYLVKPFGYKEIEAHVRAMLRRVKIDKGNLPMQRIIVGALLLDLQAHTLSKAGQEIPLRQKEFEILTLLMSNLGTVISRERLFDEVWGTDWLGDTRTLDVHISWLRAKIEDDATNPVYLQTVRGVGYRFNQAEGA